MIYKTKYLEQKKGIKVQTTAFKYKLQRERNNNELLRVRCQNALRLTVFRRKIRKRYDLAKMWWQFIPFKSGEFHNNSVLSTKKSTGHKITLNL